MYNSRDARVNIMIFAAILMIFALTMIFTEAMTVTLRTPGNFTFNATTNRNVNITFNATWFFGGATPSPHENQSHCSLWVNSTTNAIAWQRVKFINFTLNNTANQPDDAIYNGSARLSHMNYTFTGDGNFTFAIGCFNASNSSAFGGTYNASNLTFSSNFSIFVDASPPGFNFSEINVSIYNTSVVAERVIEFKLNDSGLGLNMSLNNSINLSVFLGGTRVRFLSYLNSSGSTNLSCTATSPDITTAIVTCNATYNFNSNGSYLINTSAQDALASFNTSATTLVVDQIPPIITKLNFSNNGTLADILGSTTPSTVQAAGRGTWAQGRQLYGIVNATDNLTAVIHGYLQFYNLTSSTWTTVNSTMNGGLNASPFGTNTNSTINLSYVIPTGHNVFEGVNISFRYLVNDTVGNINTSFEVVNVTIQINDTAKPTIEVRIGGESGPLNNTNTSDATPTIIWNITEGNSITYISIQIDGASNTGDDVTCSKFKNFSSSVSANLNRNGSITILDTGECIGQALLNGTHTVNLSVLDTWGNSERYVHQFFVQSGKPGLVFNNILAASGRAFGSAVQNITNITSPYVGLNFSGLGANINVQNLTYVSSCNSASTVVFTNNTAIYPFNESTCGTSSQSGNVTLKVTVTDNLGNSNSTVFGFLLDNLAPTIAVHVPTEGATIANIVNVSVSAFDSESQVDTIAYYLDGSVTLLNHSINGSRITSGPGQNTSIQYREINFTPGTHTIKISVNDSLGNTRNSSVITFTQTGPINFISIGFNASSGANTTLEKYNIIPFVNLSTIEGSPLEDTRTVTNANLSLLLAINHSPGKLFNITFKFNGSAANWDKYNFSVTMNNTDKEKGIAVNQSAVVLNSIFLNDSVDEFLPDSGYYGIVKIPGVNLSDSISFGGTLQIWYFEKFNDTTSKVNVTACGSGFAPSLTSNTGMPCWNITDNYTATVFVPHFSIVALVNDTTAPTVNVSVPSSANQTTGMFVPNITVSSDATSCLSSLNGTEPNLTMTKSGNICLGQTERFKNLNSLAGNYNFTFTVTDESGNINRYVWKFNVTDGTAPDNGLITSSADVTTATVTITGTNETVNATVNYGTTNTSLSSSATETDFNQTQVVSLSGLSASTTYYYNVTVCDFNGNCKTNISTFSFATIAAATEAAAAAAASSGGGGGAAPTSNVAASTGTQWDSLEAGSSGTVNVNNEKIAVTSIVIEVANTVTSPSVNVQSFTSNPLSSSAAAKVYQYLQLTKSNLADSDASKITISFKVPKSWLTSNGVTESDIVLWRYAGGSWNKLDTKLVSSDGSFANYEAVTPGLSTFAIGNKEAGTSAFAIIDMIRDFYDGTSKLTAFDIIDQIRSFYGG